ncbi:tRNA (guanosine(37)-N1)-methyltransferase TrmD [Ligilactobacillus ceti]|uniref:tRNA (guanine-N(1)-)-methyltransferase n=1 Tax=Ligilactobacillus ceti DSM 22408 TaxID=1122146 RepID=A0A0R2KMD5_9LACO|nr:tRNA (guanosine(37)-N1)-methyltransferase TrmD [Ligilactobacillus ceti]KRN88613.1 tRNA (guanine-N(1)-)-methyltransferase [Ligilactobacillus ceti DSM 22408]
MKIDVLSLFPEMFTGPMYQSMVGNAIKNGILDFKVTDFRQFTTNKQKHVDDTPYGGGAGMLLQVQPIFAALDEVQKDQPNPGRVILLDPAGKRFDQKMAEELAQEEHLTFICGHYEGYDERIRSRVTDEISLGDFVLTGGELGAMVVIDATVRLLPDVLGNRESAIEDSFSTGLLEHPHYTRPVEYEGMVVPEVLRSGNHKLIAEWRHKESLRRTYLRRPDMLEGYEFTKQEKIWLEEIKNEEKQEK